MKLIEFVLSMTPPGSETRVGSNTASAALTISSSAERRVSISVTLGHRDRTEEGRTWSFRVLRAALDSFLYRIIV